jgi:hypothetical protein
MSKSQSSPIDSSIFEYGIFDSTSIELSSHNSNLSDQNSNRHNDCFGRFRNPNHRDRHQSGWVNENYL